MDQPSYSAVLLARQGGGPGGEPAATLTSSSTAISTTASISATVADPITSGTTTELVVTESSSTSSGQIIYKTQTIYETRTSKPSPAAGATQHSGLSSGDIASVVVAIVVALLAVAGIAFFCLRQRRRKKRDGQPREIQDTGQTEALRRHEKDGISISELHRDPVLFEARDGALHEMAAHIELEGDRPERP